MPVYCVSQTVPPRPASILIHTYIRTYIHAYIHTYIRIYIHAYIHTCSGRPNAQSRFQLVTYPRHGLLDLKCICCMQTTWPDVPRCYGRLPGESGMLVYSVHPVHSLLNGTYRNLKRSSILSSTPCRTSGFSRAGAQRWSTEALETQSFADTGDRLRI